MGATIQQDSGGIWVVRLSGALRKQEMDEVQAQGVMGGLQQGGGAVRVLVMVEPDFSGWVGGEVWNDMTFFVKYGDRIARMAIVGDPRWESRMLMFTGAGFRRTQVKYFPTERVADAYAWLG